MFAPPPLVGQSALLSLDFEQYEVSIDDYSTFIQENARVESR